jgi:bifunctional DNase/RNase
VRIEVERIIFFSGADLQWIVLRETDGHRRLTFTTGYVEAAALWWSLKREPSPRPLTHQALVVTIATLGARVESACVLSRSDGTYYSEVRLLRDRGQLTIDVRPSDALVIALQADVPFLFRKKLWESDAVSGTEPAPERRG